MTKRYVRVTCAFMLAVVLGLLLIFVIEHFFGGGSGGGSFADNHRRDPLKTVNFTAANIPPPSI